MRLNKYIAHCGVASRRKADVLIKEGHIQVNGTLIKEPGYRLATCDEVTYKGSILQIDTKYYVLLNKPKGFLSTTVDDRGRKTVIDLVMPSLLKQIPHKDIRLYPVGRLDRQTTGLLLLTNDGQMAQRLAHPSGNVKKIYKVVLDKPLQWAHLKTISKGVLLDEGLAQIDQIAYASLEDKTEIGIELHMGWNRVIRRIFEKYGYSVIRLDRVMYAGLTKWRLPRGKWRFLTHQERLVLTKK